MNVNSSLGAINFVVVLFSFLDFFVFGTGGEVGGLLLGGGVGGCYVSIYPRCYHNPKEQIDILNLNQF